MRHPFEDASISSRPKRPSAFPVFLFPAYRPLSLKISLNLLDIFKPS